MHDRWMTQADMLKILDTIVSAKKLIDGGWCQHVFCTDKDDNPVQKESTKAVKFSLSGALYKITDGDARFYRAVGQMKSELDKRGFKSLGHFNNDKSTKKEDVLKFLYDVGQYIMEKSKGLPPGKDD